MIIRVIRAGDEPAVHEADIVTVNRDEGDLVVKTFAVDGVLITWSIYAKGHWLEVEQTESPSPEAITAMDKFEKEAEDAARPSWAQRR